MAGSFISTRVVPQASTEANRTERPGKGGTWTGWGRFGSPPAARWRSDPRDLPRSSDVSWHEADPRRERRNDGSVIRRLVHGVGCIATKDGWCDPFLAPRGAISPATAIPTNRTRSPFAWQGRSHPSPPHPPSTCPCLPSPSSHADAAHNRNRSNGHGCGGSVSS